MAHDTGAPIRADQAQSGFSWGAVPDGEGLWRFSLWRPGADEVLVRLGGRDQAMARDGSGGFHARLTARAGDTYVFVVDGTPVADPASRAQADGVEGASMLVDPGQFVWSAAWQGGPWHEAVIYELHIGTFTEKGTFRAAAERMRDLAAMGITAIELMPVAQFAGSRGWGYDGVLHYAPHPAYGTPDDLRFLIDTAQSLGLMVFLDVVYNHFGSVGNPQPAEFFDSERHTPWGRGIDFSKDPVRRFFLENAVMWLTEYRLDGLRFDAVHQIIDTREPEFLVEMARALRKLDLGRPVHLITEDERNLPYLREMGLYDAEWNDDYHHAIHVLLTGEDQGYYAAAAVDPMADLIRALGQGQVRQGQQRGEEPPTGLPSGHLPWTAFVNANQNHDQIGNRAQGDRLTTLADPAAVETAMALLLLSPFIPLLFMGEEVGERAPFLFFADFRGEMADLTRDGRRAEFAQMADADEVPDPMALSTLNASRPFLGDPVDMARWLDLTRTWLGLRATHVVPLLASGRRTGRAGQAGVTRTGARSLAVSWPFNAGTLILQVNLGTSAEPVRGTGTLIYSLGDVGTDPFALSLAVTR